MKGILVEDIKICKLYWSQVWEGEQMNPSQVGWLGTVEAN